MVESTSKAVQSNDHLKNKSKVSTKIMNKKDEDDEADQNRTVVEKSVADVSKGKPTSESNSTTVVNKNQSVENKGKEELASGTSTISNSLFRKKKRIRSTAKVAEESHMDSDTSVNMESLENSPVKPCTSSKQSRASEQTEKPVENCLLPGAMETLNVNILKDTGTGTDTGPVNTGTTDVKPPPVEKGSQELTPGRANAFTLLMKKKQPTTESSPNQTSR
jgi:hypothetical protein